MKNENANLPHFSGLADRFGRTMNQSRSLDVAKLESALRGDSPEMDFREFADLAKACSVQLAVRSPKLWGKIFDEASPPKGAGWGGPEAFLACAAALESAPAQVRVQATASLIEAGVLPTRSAMKARNDSDKWSAMLPRGKSPSDWAWENRLKSEAIAERKAAPRMPKM